MSEHFITLCVECREVISQCRCPDLNKTIHYSLCKTCKETKDGSKTIVEPGKQAHREPEAAR